MEITDEMLAVLDQSSGPTGLLECLEIKHSKWPAMRYVINSSYSHTVIHEDGTSYAYLPMPIGISKSAQGETLDQELSFNIGDLGETIPDLIDLIIYDEVVELPLISYRAYLIGKYNNPVAISKDLELEEITRDWQASRGDAKAPGLNDTGNGEVYSASTNPSLIGFY